MKIKRVKKNLWREKVCGEKKSLERKNLWREKISGEKKKYFNSSENVKSKESENSCMDDTSSDDDCSQNLDPPLCGECIAHDLIMVYHTWYIKLQ